MILKTLQSGDTLYETTEVVIEKLGKLSDWLEVIPAENKDEEFFIDWIQTQVEEMKELSIFFLKTFK